MAITKETEIAKIEVVGEYKAVQIATDTVIKEDGTEISRSRHRHVLHPFSSDYVVESDGSKTWTHKATDISGEDASVQAIANAIWTDKVKADYKTFRENGG